MFHNTLGHLHKMNIFRVFLGAFLWIWAFVSIAAAQVSPAQSPGVEIRPFADHKAIQPGVEFDLALQVQIEKNWHTYWKNNGDTGMAPSVRWKAPEGFRFSDLIHPVPKRHRDPGDISSYIHEGSPIFLVHVVPPADLKPGTTVTLTGDVRLLVCEKQCVIVNRTIQIELPVADIGQSVDRANEEILEEARAALPESARDAKYLKLLPVVSMDKVVPDQAFQFALVLDIQKGYHIQSNAPLQDYLIPTDVFLDQTGGITFDKAQYPPPAVRSLTGGEKSAEFSGRVVVRYDVQPDHTLPPGSLKIAGILRYQSCADSGQCFPPQNIEWSSDVPTGSPGDRAQPVHPEYFSAAATPPETSSTGPQEAGGAARGPVPAAVVEAKGLERFLRGLGWPGLLLGCFLYGLCINATPCVLPLLSIKVLDFVQQAHESRQRTALLGLVFGAGVMIFFVVLGLLAAAGKNVLQFPQAVIALGTIVMVLALSLLGVYTLQPPAAVAQLETGFRREGIWASFGKGALAPVLGFACTGPLLAGAFGWATQQQPHVAVVAFLITGLGMASPYMVVGANPRWLSFIPKPGMWMVTFERLMGFLLLAMVVWLLNPLVVQIGAEGLQWTLIFLVMVGLACWVWGRIHLAMSTATMWKYRLTSLGIVVLAGGLIFGWIYPLSRAAGETENATHSGTPWVDVVPWEKWSPKAVEDAVKSGHTVFVDFTAAYCAECRINKRMVLYRPEVLDKMRADGIVPFQGDFTTYDPQIAEMLRRFGRAGLPLDLIYPAGQPDQPLVLDINLTIPYVLGMLEQAGPSSER